ncbi:DEAD-box ATP-dependent RNA helicase 42 [Citrus sinensis]|uniref:DEAD-box ATP-dependent RNA helicase 42 n=1 Tax=Citrus sinensis TaxID=2711 RepID=A0ACB8LJZ1_CITSI|nr:DEAD-box ATP-dependent RNA helicase 42 [Citrus sinensis]
MSPAYRKQLDLKIREKCAPKPIKTWRQTGLTTKILETFSKLNHENPVAIQAPASALIISGLDSVAITETGSGKTLAFLLPMLRHIWEQPPVVPGDDSPVGLVMAPTGELVRQQVRRGRMIDLLCKNGVKITNLTRVTYLVLDEADRMFDMGFEPQITRIVQNIRPDRQAVLFSPTFPPRVEILAREWRDKGKALIFVNNQERSDVLFRDLLKHSPPSLLLLESSIYDFKTNVCNLSIANSVRARGLDEKELELVINFDAPNDYEDYVHHVGSAARAGSKAVPLVVRDDLKAVADSFIAKVNRGLGQVHGTGHGGVALNLMKRRIRRGKQLRKAQAKEYGFGEDKSDSEDVDEGTRKSGGDISHQDSIAKIATIAAASNSKASASTPSLISVAQLLPNGGPSIPLPGVLGLSVPGGYSVVLMSKLASMLWKQDRKASVPFAI